ncbi:HHL102Wp [Eremothecium sinecaudum]|uniref:HHL102Wp n=1 Tax=Eremothecium sinecaudum TaxID=45286 RepID=A0A120K2U6_9SACH|nr:HHL102Wp [Eremothecium sinecaudum]AMD22668.1 HHL102Wp [Eremothecium sinecaudum]
MLNTVEETPVKQDLGRKQKLRDAILLSTPGWLNAEASSPVKAGNDAQKVRLYLKELSSALLNSGKVSSSMQVLVDEKSFVEEERKRSNSRSVEREWRGLNLSQEVFSGLGEYGGRKLRRLNISVPIEIRSDEEMDDGDISIGSIVAEVSDVVDDLSAVGDLSSPINGYRGEDLEEFEEIEDNMPSSAPMLSAKSLRALVTSIVNEGNYAMPPEAVKRLRKLSGVLARSVAEDIHATCSESGSKVIDRAVLLRVFDKYGIINEDDVTNQDLFGLCQRYLPVEALNSLELHLFQG